MAFGVIDPGMWDERQFVELTGDSKLLWFYLLTGPEACKSCPGLLQVGIAGLAECLRWATQDTKTSLQQLVGLGWVELDESTRLIRIPKAPHHRKPSNPNVVTGWWRRWKELPESALKYSHIESLEAVCARFSKTWANTFGGVTVPERFLNGLGNPLETLSLLEPIKNIDVGVDETVAQPFLNGCRSYSSIGDPRSLILDPETPTVYEPGPPRSPPPLAEGTHPGVVAEPRQVAEPQRQVAEQLWTRQEELRRGVPGLQPLSLDADGVDRVLSCLAFGDWTSDQAEHVLAVFQADALRDDDKIRWFNGFANWSPKAFRVALGMSSSAGRNGGYVPADNTTKYSGGRVL